MNIIRIAPIFLYLSVFPAFSEDHSHCDHEHGGHDHDSAATEADDEISNLLRQLGFSLEMVEDRIIGDEEVTALPLSSIIAENGKTFVLAQSEEDTAKFERWEVSLGRNDGRFVEAITGVFPGDHVVGKAQENPAFQSQPESTGFASSYGRAPDEARNPSSSFGYQAPRQSDPPAYRDADPAPIYRQPAPLYSDGSGARQYPDYRPGNPQLQGPENRYEAFQIEEPYGGEFYVCPHGKVHTVPRCEYYSQVPFH